MRYALVLGLMSALAAGLTAPSDARETASGFKPDWFTRQSTYVPDVNQGWSNEYVYPMNVGVTTGWLSTMPNVEVSEFGPIKPFGQYNFKQVYWRIKRVLVLRRRPPQYE